MMNMYKKIMMLSLFAVSGVSIFADQTEEATKSIAYQDEAHGAALIAQVLGGGGSDPALEMRVTTLEGQFDTPDFATGSTLEQAVGTNTTNIATNTANIATNATAISNNATAISTNTTAIASNTTAISNNATAISTNTTNITNNANAIAALQASALTTNTIPAVSLAQALSSVCSNKTIIFEGVIVEDNGSNVAFIHTGFNDAVAFALDTDPASITSNDFSGMLSASNLELISSVPTGGQSEIDGNVYIVGSNTGLKVDGADLLIKGDLRITDGPLILADGVSPANLVVEGDLIVNSPLSQIDIEANCNLTVNGNIIFLGSEINFNASANIVAGKDIIIDGQELTDKTVSLDGMITGNTVRVENYRSSGLIPTVRFGGIVNVENLYLTNNVSTGGEVVLFNNMGSSVKVADKIILEGNTGAIIIDEALVEATTTYFRDNVDFGVNVLVYGILQSDVVLEGTTTVSSDLRFDGSIEFQDDVAVSAGIVFQILGNVVVQGGVAWSSSGGVFVRSDFTHYGGNVFLSSTSTLNVGGDVLFDGAGANQTTDRFAISGGLTANSLTVRNYAANSLDISGALVSFTGIGLTLQEGFTLDNNNNRNQNPAVDARAVEFKGFSLEVVTGDFIIRNSSSTGAGAAAVFIDGGGVTARNIIFDTNVAAGTNTPGCDLQNLALTASHNVEFIRNQGNGTGVGVDMDFVDVLAANLIADVDCSAGSTVNEDVEWDDGSKVSYYDPPATLVELIRNVGGCSVDLTP